MICSICHTDPYYKKVFLSVGEIQDRMQQNMIIQTSYNIHRQTLTETAQAKYLGVTIDNKLSWNSHVDLVTKETNQITAFLRRNLSACLKDVKEKCYKSLVRPQLEYAVTIWNPYTKANSTKVEAVQRRAASFCFNDYSRKSAHKRVLLAHNARLRRYNGVTCG